MADPEDPPLPEASSTPVDDPHPRGALSNCKVSTHHYICKLYPNSIFLLLHGIIVALLLLHTILAFVFDVLAMEIVAYPAIACLLILGPSDRTENIVFGAFLAVLTVIVVILEIIIEAGKAKIVILFVANIVAISWYCIWKVALSVCRAFAPDALSNCEAFIQHYTCRLYLIAQPWLQYIPDNIGFLLVHGVIVALLLLHIILALIFDNLGMQIVAYPAIVCLYIWAPSGWTEILVSAAFLGALALIVVFVSVGARALDTRIMFVANIVAISLYCIWKLYVGVKPWLRYWFRKVYPIAHPWLQYLPALAPRFLEEETGLLSQQQATFRIQADLPRQFSPGEIRAMTQDFGNMVGQGGFAQVFRGLLEDGTAVAVKRITTTGDGEAADFLREISIVANVHHRSLLRLLGYCLQRRRESNNRYLVYPFLENGSLDSWLFHGGEGRRRLLPWPTRRSIAVDVAKALAYLHHECHQQILHLDIKPGNILLDGDLRAHVSDFGISMSVTRGLSNVDTRGRGTPGYMAPEMMVNAVSAKSDVFSYGMTLLELVGGRRNFEPTDADSSTTPDFSRDFFPYIVREKMARGDLMEAVDSAMALVDQGEVETVVKVALSCIQSRWDMRPSMLTVVDMLEGRVVTDLPTESRRLSTVNLSDLLSSSLTHGR
ncbi:unnamed protein product [Urochloa humidicola]